MTKLQAAMKKWAHLVAWSVDGNSIVLTSEPGDGTEARQLHHDLTGAGLRPLFPTIHYRGGGKCCERYGRYGPYKRKRK